MTSKIWPGRGLAACACALFLLTACGGGSDDGEAPAASAASASPARQVLVIGHRGEPSSRPEHTLAAYQRAIDDGADYIEPDLVATRDGELVARHENAIAIVDASGKVVEATTNVAELPKFSGRKTTKLIDGKSITGWFTEDFTLAELKELRARERIPQIRPANTAYNDRFEVPTLDEILQLACDAIDAFGPHHRRLCGNKHPSYFRSIGLPLEGRLLDTLQKYGWNDAGAPVFVQSFETGNLKDIRRRSTVKLVQLIDGQGAPWDLAAAGDGRTYKDLLRPEGLAQIAGYAQGIGPAKAHVIPVVDGKPGTPSTLVRDAHDRKLLVHVFTLRPENNFLPERLKKDPTSDPTVQGDTAAEIQAFLDAGVDGFFADSAATAVPVVKRYLAAQPR